MSARARSVPGWSAPRVFSLFSTISLCCATSLSSSDGGCSSAVAACVLGSSASSPPKIGCVAASWGSVARPTALLRRVLA